MALKRISCIGRAAVAMSVTLLLNTAVLAGSKGMIDVKSEYPVAETADRLEAVLADKGMTVFNRIKHSEGAAKAGVELRPTELIIFGNPKVGSPLMRCQQRIALDLPQKALIWEDAEQNVWLSYNDPRYLEDRHEVSGCEEVLARIEKALAGLLKAAGSAP